MPEVYLYEVPAANEIRLRDPTTFESGGGISGDLGITEAIDTLTADGTVAGDGISANLSVTEANDTLSGVVTHPGTASLTTTEGNDSLTASGAAVASATLSAAEANDSVSATSGARVSAGISITEANDTLSAAITHPVGAALAAIDAHDALTANGTAGSGLVATLNVTTSDNTLSSNGSVDSTSSIGAGGGSSQAIGSYKKIRKMADELAAERAARGINMEYND